MHGFLSRDGLPPADLLAVGRHEVTVYGGTVLDGAVTELLPNDRSGFWVLLANGRRSLGAATPPHDRAARRAARHPGAPRPVGP